MEPRVEVAGYREYAPPDTAAAYCEALWIHETPCQPLPVGAAHRVLPEMAVSLAFLGFRGENGTPLDWSPILVGPTLHARIYALVSGRELAAVRIKPEWTGPLLGLDPMDLEDQVVDLSTVLPGLADRLRDPLARTRSPESAVRVLHESIVELRTRTRVPPSVVASHGLDLVRRSSGRAPCERVAAELGLSERHFRRQVHDSTGVSPKTYGRVLRFARAMLRSDTSARPAWADLALESGYCDQSHLIRECVALSGLSPADLHRERRRQVIEDAVSVSSNTR